MVDIKTKPAVFSCGRCGNTFSIEKKAEDCCSERQKEVDWTNAEVFELKQVHLDLLKQMVIGWQDCEFGAPEIDPKRPYGNSDVEDDIAEIIHLEKTKDNYDIENEIWTQKTFDYLNDLHHQTQIALEIVLHFQSFKLGKYRRKDKYSYEWIFGGDS